jgi:hypothetical protein
MVIYIDSSLFHKGWLNKLKKTGILPLLVCLTINPTNMQISLQWNFEMALTTYLQSFSPKHLTLTNSEQIAFHSVERKHLDSSKTLASSNQIEIAEAFLSLDCVEKVGFDKFGMSIEFATSNNFASSKEILEQTITELFPSFTVSFN